MNKIIEPPCDIDDEGSHLNEQESLFLFEYFKDQHERVGRRYGWDVDIFPEFMGFVSTYKLLSQLIPKHFTVVDIGCSYNPQCFYFKDHTAIISICPSTTDVYSTENCIFKQQKASEFIESDLYKSLDLNTTFAICNYVPEWYNENAKEITRNNFLNMYIFYPHS
jgi:hypothetical protein